MENLTVVKLRQLCKDMHIKNYSGLNKANLIRLVGGQESIIEDKDDVDKMTILELRRLCKSNGLSGYSKLNKSDLLEFVKMNC